MSECDLCAEAIKLSKAASPVRKAIKTVERKLSLARKKKQRSASFIKELARLSNALLVISAKADIIMAQHDGRCGWCGMLYGKGHMMTEAGLVLGKSSCAWCVREYATMGKDRWLMAGKGDLL